MTKNLALAAAFAAAFGGNALAADLPSTITFGSSMQLTGQDANLGRYYRDAYTLTIDQINKAGGIKIGGKSVPITLKLLDNQSDANLAVRQYVGLVTQDKVDFLLGPYASGTTIPVSSVSEKYQIPMVEGGGASPQIFSRGYKYIFGLLPPADDYFASTITMLEQLQPKAKTVALVTADDAFDVSVAKGTRKLLKAANMEIVLDQSYAAKTTDFSSIMAQIKSKQPDVVFWGGLEPEVLNALRQSKSLDVNPKLLMSFTVGVPAADFRKALGNDANDAFGMTAWLPAPALKDDWFGDAAKFAAAYKAKYGYDPDYHVAAGAAAVETLVKAIEKAGSLDKAKVRDALAASDFDSLYAHVKFNAGGQIVVPQIVIQIQNGQVAPVFTDKFIDKPVFPVPPWNKRG
ncbi:MAG TPA: amino acid ABC transporter substrate-binding protein [Stellaceae bacterium]|jgi:branched-chain amino acid transport system substrate-binding protein|nr:amino acid ABC transporter substrate-binding protein [Stellaceae bacterium]